MNFYLTFFEIIFLFFVCAENEINTLDVKTLPPEISSILKSTSPEISATIELVNQIKNLVHTTHESKIISFHNNAEKFSMLQSNFDQSQGTTKYNNMIKLMNFWLGLTATNIETRNAVINAFSEYILQDGNHHFETKKFSIQYSNALGKMILLVIQLSPSELHPDIVNYKRILLVSDFVPANDFVVIQESDCDFFGCQSSQRINYLPAYITDQHIKAILGIFTNMIVSTSLYLDSKSSSQSDSLQQLQSEYNNKMKTIT